MAVSEQTINMSLGRWQHRRKQQFFTGELGVTEVIDLARAHRMGKATPGKTRPIVAKFERYQQREKVRMAGPRRAGKRFWVSEQIPKEWQDKLKPLLPHFKEAKKQGKRVRFVGPKLLVEGHFVTTGVPPSPHIGHTRGLQRPA